MPLYEYACQGCGHKFEKLVFRGEGDVSCPQCEGEVHKLFSTFSAHSAGDVCLRLPKGEQRELCTGCRAGGSSCPMSSG